MNKHVSYLTTICMLAVSCNLNQHKDGLRQGRWIFKDSTATGVSISKGRFNRGNEVGIWKFYEDEILYKKEKYKGDVITVKTYYPNSKLKAHGFNKQVRTEQGLHWYYTGKWKYYSDNGRLDSSKIFHKGEEVSKQFH